MKKILSFNSKFGWISAIEINGRITEIKFSKKKNLSKSMILKKFKFDVTNFFFKKNKKI